MNVLKTTDLEFLKIINVSFDLSLGKAEIKIQYKNNSDRGLKATMPLYITAWIWLIGGTWREGWAISRPSGLNITMQAEEHLKTELYKILLPYFKENLLTCNVFRRDK